MLSPREKQILKHKQNGLSNERIGELLGLKTGSVRTISHIIVLKCTGKYEQKSKKQRKTSIDYKQFTDNSVLSTKEKEVLKYRQEGVPGRKIAEILGIKIESVWCISHTIVLKCTGQYDAKKRYEYSKKSMQKRLENDEQYAENMQAYRREYMRQYNEKNKEKRKEKNTERLREYHREYYKKHKEKIKEYQREYQKKRKLESTKPKSDKTKTEKIKSERRIATEQRNAEIYQRYLNGENMTDIGKDIGLSRQRIHVIISDIKKRNEDKKIKRSCVVCGKAFKGTAHNLYCSSECKNIVAEQRAKKHTGEIWQGMEILDMFIKNNKEYAVLNCKVCGKQFQCRYDSLVRGQKSCGCDQSKPSERSEIIGKKFGMLTPVEEIGSKNGSILYLCKCDCGGEIKTTAKNLNYGSAKSCGCKNIERFKNADREAWGWKDGTNTRALERGTMWNTNTSGVKGVSWNTSNKGWIVRITYKSKVYHLGTFKKDEMDAAIEVRKEAEKAVLEKRFDEWIVEYKRGKDAQKS